jgi:hypothetical protein
VDEFQYGDNPVDRSNAAKHILETFTQLPHTQIGGKKLHQPTKTLVVNPTPLDAYPDEMDIQLSLNARQMKILSKPWNNAVSP